MKPGDLIRYWSMDSVPVYGIVTTGPFVNHELGDSERVTVYWFDDDSLTDEEIEILLDSSMEYMELISESG